MRVVLGVGGGIAAYKACDLASRLVKAAHEVQVVMTEAAARFVGSLTFAGLTGRPVAVGECGEPMGPLSHVELAHWADALIIAPATADLMARLAHGHADDMLSAIYLGFRGPVILAPAMEPEMWENVRTQANARRLQDDGAFLVGPESGRTASGRVGVGRMAEPSSIVRALVRATTPKDLKGVRVLVTAGATWEFYDPVRMLTNPATGLMGVLLAEMALDRGAEVVLVHGPRVAANPEEGLTVVPVVSAEEMLTAVLKEAEAADVVIGAAAVSDFRPARPMNRKAHKDQLGSHWEMARNPDILAEVSRRYRSGRVLVGFAAETDDVVASATAKLTAKGLDAVLANQVGAREGFGDWPHRAWLVTQTEVQALPGDKKPETARAVLDYVVREREKRAGRDP